MNDSTKRYTATRAVVGFLVRSTRNVAQFAINTGLNVGHAVADELRATEGLKLHTRPTKKVQATRKIKK